MTTPEPTISATEDVTIYKSFDEMGLPEQLLRGIYSHGFEVPSAIQQKGIVPIKDGLDVLAQAQSGTGKTGTFTIGSLCKIDPALKRVQVLILVPVRELAQQIETVAKSISVYMGISVYSATGGTPVREDSKAIEKGCQFLIGTPGRIYDLMNRNVLSSEHIRVLIFDVFFNAVSQSKPRLLSSLLRWIRRWLKLPVNYCETL